MRTVVLLCAALAACGGQAAPPAAAPAPGTGPQGCWELFTINFRSAWVPQPTRVQLDAATSPQDPPYQRLVRLTRPPAGVVNERSYWYVNPGDRHVMIRLGDPGAGVLLDLAPDADWNRMYGKADAGSNVRASRVACP